VKSGPASFGSRLDGALAPAAAVEGAASRLRAILITGCEMIAGMLPMAEDLAKAAATI
jgi:Cu/Ag efflux pump CusA